MMNQIDYESPTHQLNEILFDVRLQDVYSNSQLPDTLFKQPISTPYYKAIVNQQNGQILSVVGRNYRLIPNKVALEMGKELFLQLYPGIKVNKLIPYKVVAPASKASAHIDLIHKDVNFDVWEQETWLPFLRVTNSYNRSYALAFEIGFVRKLCSNGMLFNKRSIKLKYVHSNTKALNIQNDISKIGEVTGSFIKQCILLREFFLPREMMFAFVCHIMKLNLELPASRQLIRKLNTLEDLYTLTNSLTTQYSNGETVSAYTALNVVTDIVSHQNDYKNLTGYYFNVRSFYSKPADWMDEFSEAIKDKRFSPEKYLEPTVNALKQIENNTGFEWRLN